MLVNFTKKNFGSFIFCFLLLVLNTQVQAQTMTDSTEIWKVEMTDGNVFIGEIVNKNATTIELKTEYLGTLTLQKKNIEFKGVFKEERMVNGEIWRENAIYGKYMLSPTGMLQDKGKGYYENKFVFVNHLNIAVSNNASIGVGLVPAFLFDGASTPVWLTAQFRIKTINENLHICAGGFFTTFLFDEYTGNIGIANVAATYGNRDISFTAGAGHGVFEGDWLRAPTLTFSGSIRVSRRTYIFVENIFVHVESYRESKEQLYISSIGTRTMWRRISLDFGLVGMKDTDRIFFYNDSNFGVVPYLGIVVPFR